MLGCKGEERGERREEKGGSTYPKTTVMSITGALATALEEGSDPSCPDRKDQGFLFKDLPRAPDAAIQSRSTPQQAPAALIPQSPIPLETPVPQPCPCSYLPAAGPAAQAAAAPRAPGVHHGRPQPPGPGPRPAGRAQRCGRGIAHAGSQALGQAGGRHGHEGHPGARPALIKGDRCRAPWGRQRQWSSGSRRRRWGPRGEGLEKVTQEQSLWGERGTSWAWGPAPAGMAGKGTRQR